MDGPPRGRPRLLPLPPHLAVTGEGPLETRGALKEGGGGGLHKQGGGRPAQGGALDGHGGAATERRSGTHRGCG
jgi:hypothetical protein